MKHVFRLLGEFSGGTWSVPKEEKHHALKVLRLQPGDQIEICDGKGRVDSCELSHDENGGICFVSLGSQCFPKPVVRTVLICPALDHGELDDVIEGFVEAGADCICVYLPEGADKKRIGPKKTERWLQKIRGATKQCKRAYLPELKVFSSLKACLKDCRSHADSGFKLYVGAPDGVLANTLTFKGQPSGTLGFVCGSEHGLSSDELQAVQAESGLAICLGPHVLRARTAALLGAAALEQVRSARLS